MNRPLFRIILGCWLISIGLSARAAEYSWDVSGAANRVDRDPRSTSDLSAVSATYYFLSVDDSRGPFALASFLDPVTQLSASVQRTTATTHGIISAGTGPPIVFSPDLTTHTRDDTVAGRYVLRGQTWYVGGSYTDSRVQPSFYATTRDRYDVLAGRYFGRRTSLELGFDRHVSRSHSSVVVCCAVYVPLNSRQTTDNVRLGVTHVREARSFTYALSGEVTSTNEQSVAHIAGFDSSSPVVVHVPPQTFEGPVNRYRMYSVAAGLYPALRIGVRLVYTRWDGPAANDNAFDVGVSWFVTRGIELQFSVGQQRSRDFYGLQFPDARTRGLQVTGRF